MCIKSGCSNNFQVDTAQTSRRFLNDLDVWFRMMMIFPPKPFVLPLLSPFPNRSSRSVPSLTLAKVASSSLLARPSRTRPQHPLLSPRKWTSGSRGAGGSLMRLKDSLRRYCGVSTLW